MNNRTPRIFAMLLIVMLNLSSFSAKAYADGVETKESQKTTVMETIVASESTMVIEKTSETSATPAVTKKPVSSTKPTAASEAAVPLTPDGNLTLVDDIKSQASENKQFITVLTKAGNTFYIIIDRAANKDNVYFLNMVDEVDLLALIEDKDGIVGNTTGGAVPTKPAPTAKPETEPTSSSEVHEPENSQSSPVLLVLLVLLVAGGGALWFLKLRKPKQSAKGNTNLDEYDFDEADDEIYEREGTAVPDKSSDESEVRNERDFLQTALTSG